MPRKLRFEWEVSAENSHQPMRQTGTAHATLQRPRARLACSGGLWADGGACLPTTTATRRHHNARSGATLREQPVPSSASQSADGIRRGSLANA